MDKDKCLRCGKCCHLGIYSGNGEVVRTGISCMYLTKDNLCSVYSHRPGWCLTAERMAQLGILPDGCGYKMGD